MAAEFFEAGQVKYWQGKTFVEEDVTSGEVAGVMNACGLETSQSGDIRNMIWGKVVVNCVVNPLTAILRVRDNEIITKTLAAVRHQIVRECVHVGKAEGLTFRKDLEKEIDGEIAEYTNFSSMCQDIMKGNKTEIDFLNGKIVELGGKHHISTPVNEIIVSFIKFLEENNELSRKN